MKIGWTLNVVIMEAGLTRAERKWYLEQAKIRNWTKAGLQLAMIAEEFKAAFAETAATIIPNQVHCQNHIVQLERDKEIEKILLHIFACRKEAGVLRYSDVS